MAFRTMMHCHQPRAQFLLQKQKQRARSLSRPRKMFFFVSGCLCPENDHRCGSRVTVFMFSGCDVDPMGDSGEKAV
jgi:hypothetical protein